MWMGIIKDLLLAMAFALLVWTPLGRWTLRHIGGSEISYSQSISMALGMGLWGMFILLLGVLGLLHPALVLGLSVTLSGFSLLHSYLKPASSGWSEIFARPLRERVFVGAFATLSAVYFVLVLGSALAPELSFDALNVHLPYARDAAAARRLAFAPNNWSSIMPALPVMSYVAAFLFSGQYLAKLFNALSYCACGGVTFFFTRRWWGLVHGIVAATLFWSSPIALYEATTALIDLPFALYSAVAIFSLLDWTRSEKTKSLRLCAVGLGLALGCKYHAAFWILPFVCILTWHALRVRRWPLQRLLYVLLEFTLIVTLSFFPWLLRAWYYTGNPIFPVANSIFKSPFFTPAMEAAARAAYANEGVGHSWQEMIRLPWTVTFHPAPFRGTLGAIFLLGAALALARMRRVEIRYGLFLAGVYFYTWALTAQEIRYLLPLVPVLGMLSAGGFLGTMVDPVKNAPDQVNGRIFFAPALRSTAALIFLLAGAALNLPSIYTRWVTEWTYWHSYESPFNYLLGKESAQDYLSRDVPSIYVYDFVNENLSLRNRILLLNDHAQFYSKVPTLYSFTVEAEGILQQRTEEEVLRKLKESGITHVLLNYNGIAPLPGVVPREGVYFFLDKEFQEKYLEPIYSRNNVVLYRVRWA